LTFLNNGATNFHGEMEVLCRNAASRIFQYLWSSLQKAKKVKKHFALTQ
jgi:hypothetical protein